MKLKSSITFILAFLMLSAFHARIEKPKTDIPKNLKIEEFTPFDFLEVKIKVKEVSHWKKGFDQNVDMRTSSGLGFMAIGQEIKNPNDLIIVESISDILKAKEFLANPKLKQVMKNDGVISKPITTFMHMLRFKQDSTQKIWMLVTHKVKDFDAWLKVFDAEGSEGRASQGLMDLGLARGIEDPSLVQIAFYITDMEKAKASLASEEKKKLMMSAGVMSVPSFEIYNTLSN